MKTIITYERCNPSTICGETLKVTLTYTSFDKAEIDTLEEYYKQQVGTVLVTTEK